MTPITAITGCFNNIVLGLTPIERWNAVSKYHNTATTNRWFVGAGIAAVIIIALLLLIRIYRRQKESQHSEGQLFDQHAKVKKLTDREYRMLLDIAIAAGLKQNESIFKLPSTFDRQAARMIEISTAGEGTDQSRQLETDLSLLREKLDFHQYTSPDAISKINPDAQSTRQIPLKKKLYIKRNHRMTDGDLESTVVKNTPAGLTIQFRGPVEIIFGQPWICRYYSGSFVAEFKTTVAKCSGDIVVLNHSNSVELINRRKFLRVPVKNPAYVASFPFNKPASTDVNQFRTKNTAPWKVSSSASECFEPPLFIPATVTELGGPGLRIEANLDVNVGDRVLLMFKLDSTGVPTRSNRRTVPERILENIAKVRHITKKETVSSIALEFVDLNDNEIDELVRATNEVSVGMNKRRHHYPENGVRRGLNAELVSV